MPDIITIKASLMFERVHGPESDAETLHDAFAFENGAQNGAGGNALTVEVPGDGDEASVYQLKLVD